MTLVLHFFRQHMDLFHSDLTLRYSVLTLRQYSFIFRLCSRSGRKEG